MNKLMKVAAAVALTVGMLAVGGVSANATSLYNDNNYVGFLWTGTSTGSLGVPVGANDLTSSFQNSGFETYCENANCSGRRLNWSNNANALGGVNTGLGLGETWSDRISGVL